MSGERQSPEPTPAPKRARMNGKVTISTMAQNTFNPIRAIVDNMKRDPHPEKNMIALSIGDPTVFGNLPVSEVTEEAVAKAMQKGSFNGYAPSVGYESSRQAVADYVSSPGCRVEAKDIVLASGCSGALDLCISCLANAGENILIPCPGFSLYKTLAESLSIECKLYDLMPDRSWEVDLKHMESLIDSKTAAIVVCNPSNPCGSVFRREHLQDILTIAERHQIPIISDEIYEHFVFPGQTYHSMASVSKNVPILACGGLTKRFLIPGWRVGWIVINDRDNVLSEVRRGLLQLSQRLLGPNTVAQAAMVDILQHTPHSFYSDTIAHIQANAVTFFDRLSRIPGLTPVMPQGAMYMMVGIDMPHYPKFRDDVHFTEDMIKEQSVFCLPAKVFEYPNYFRLVLTVPHDKALEACDRIREFCEDHYVINPENQQQQPEKPETTLAAAAAAAPEVVPVGGSVSPTNVGK